MRWMIVCVFLVVGFAAPVAAQTHRSHWGVGASFVPTWKTPEQFDMLYEAEPADLTGSEFRIGVVRGRDLGGEWGVSFVRKRVKDGSTVGGFENECFTANTCLPFGDLYTYQDVMMTGVAAHKFVPFGTIARRVQIGMTFGGGVARFERDTVRESRSANFSGSGIVLPQIDVETVPAKEVFVLETVPLGDVQVSVAAIAAPGLKLRANGGLSFPGYHTFSVTASYLFGAK